MTHSIEITEKQKQTLISDGVV